VLGAAAGRTDAPLISKFVAFAGRADGGRFQSFAVPNSDFGGAGVDVSTPVASNGLESPVKSAAAEDRLVDSPSLLPASHAEPRQVQWFVKRNREVRTVSCGGRHTFATAMTEWIPDEDRQECMQCSAKFNITKRRVRSTKCSSVACCACVGDLAVNVYGSITAEAA
jgi:hypothetical protein